MGAGGWYDGGMKQFVEFFPVALFAGGYFASGDIYLATWLLLGGLGLQLGYERWREGAVSRRTLAIFWVAALAGGATLLFQNELFIKWKPTLVNWLFCGALLGSQWLGGRAGGRGNLLQLMLGGQVQLPPEVWRTLCLGWSAGFFLAGALNLLVAYGFSTDFWVAYKLVGGFAITLAYVLITVVYLARGGHLR